MVLVFSDKKGFTLVEFLVAVVILTVGLLGLLQSVNLSLSHNMRNQLRQEASVVADGEIAKELAKGSTSTGFDAISTTTKYYTVTRQTMNGFRNYSVTKTGTPVTDNTKQVNVQVLWHYKQVGYRQGASSLISKMQQ